MAIQRKTFNEPKGSYGDTMENTMTTTATETTTATKKKTQEKKPVTVSSLTRAFEWYVAEVRSAVGFKDETSGQVTRARFEGFRLPQGVEVDEKSAFHLFTEVGDLEGSMKKIRDARKGLVGCQFGYAQKFSTVFLDRMIGRLRCEGDLRNRVNVAREKYGVMLKGGHSLDQLSVQFWLVHDTVVEVDQIQTERVKEKDAKELADRQAWRAEREARLEGNRRAAQEVNKRHRVSVAHTLADQLARIRHAGRSAVA